jgi:pyruvate formate lyase activating enzyme
VLVPGLNDGEAELRAMGRLLAGLKRCERFEFLPYHTLGAHKWDALGLKYPLQGVRAATETDAARAMGIVDMERTRREDA